MDYQLFHINYSSLKRRGCAGNYTYILTSHKYPVRRGGYADTALLKNIYSSMPKVKIYDIENSRFVSPATDDNIRFASSVARSKSKVLQLASNNKWDYFVTLTFNKDKIDRYDLKEIKKVMLKFFDNYKQRKSNNFKYLLVPEQHKDGAFHFHGLFAGVSVSDLFTNEFGYLDFLPYKNKFGFCSLSPIKDLEKCASYVTKYISKDMFQTVPEPRTHLYFCSRGLKVDEVLAVGHLSAELDTSKLQCCESEFCVKYFSPSPLPVDIISPFENTVKAFSLNNINVQALQHKALFDFCNCNGITINSVTDINRLYKVLKDDIISSKINEYELLKQELQSYITVYNSNELLPDEVDALEAIFVHNVVNDLVEDASSAPLPCEQLSIFNNFNGGDYNALE